MKDVILLVHDVRSAHNVGSLLRTADGLGVKEVLLSGFTPYPKHQADARLPHIADRVHRQIHKTALGAEDTVRWQKIDNPVAKLNELKKHGYLIAALEQTLSATDLSKFKTPRKIVLAVGNEIDGLDQRILSEADIQLHIPMRGQKESFNVAIAAAIALYKLIN